MAEKRELEILIQAKDQASQTIKGIEGTLKNLEAPFKKVSQVGAVAFGALSVAVGSTIKAFAESEAQLTRTDQAIKNIDLEAMGTDFGTASQKARDFGSSLQKLSGISDEAGAESFAKLLAITNDYTEAQKLATLASDLSISKQIDMDSATKLVSMAIAGNTRILKEYGIEVAEGASKQEILGAIMEKVGGQAEAYGQTTQGQLQIMKESFGDLQEEIGSAFIPVLSSLLEAVKPIIDNVISWVSQNKELVKNIVLVVGGITAFMAVAYPLIKVIQIATTVFKALQVVALLFNTTLWANPITWVIAGIIALIAIIWVLIANWDSVVQVWQTSIAIIRDLFAKLGEWIDTVFARTFNWVILKIENLKNAFKAVGDFISNIFLSIGESIKGAFKATINFVIDKINWLIKQANKITSALSVVPGVNIPRIPEIPMLAKGGIVNKPTLAMIGEAGAEAVVPLNKRNNPLGGGLTIIVNGDVSGQDLIDKVSEAIMGNLRNNTQLAL